MPVNPEVLNNEGAKQNKSAGILGIHARVERLLLLHTATFTDFIPPSVHRSGILKIL